MPSIRITSFAGINTEIAPRLAPSNVAQIAHNCLLWDGTLRPLAKWTKMQGVAFADVASIALGLNNTILASPLSETVFMQGEKYLPDTRVGLLSYFYSLYDSNIVYTNRSTFAGGIGVGIHAPPINISSGISYQRAYHSDKPVNRMYAVSGIRETVNGIEESTLSLMPNQSPQSILYEGDNATITLNITALVPYEYTGFRLYRSISGMDTGIDTTNELDTEWYLIDELRGGTTDGILYSYTYVDGGSATTDSLDAYLAGSFYPPRKYLYKYLQNTEGGWLVAVTEEGQISVSERYLYHAWPIENFYTIPGRKITDCVAQLNTVFIGTEHEPYIMAVAPGEKLGLQVSIDPFPEAYACLPGTMDKTPSGAVYASPSGLVSLSREGMRLATAGVTRGVRALHKIERQTVEYTRHYPMRFQHTVYGAYWHGTYFGFCRVDTPETVVVEGVNVPLFLFAGYMADMGSSLDGARELQKFVTFDTPANVRAHTSTGSGLYVLATDGVYRMPFPDTVGAEAYNNAPKYCYNWKSKKFVFPGQMTMAACKVVHDCKGFVRIKFIVDCCCRYEVLVENCKPFTLPPSMVGVEWEVEVEGTAAVSEIHLASSLRELIEHESST